jgi:hypothetical protein
VLLNTNVAICTALFGQYWHENEVSCPNEGPIRTRLAENEEPCPNEGPIRIGLAWI